METSWKSVFSKMLWLLYTFPCKVQV